MDDTTVDDTSSFDLDISNVGSSTPMNSSFLSPIKKFDNLHLHNLSDIHEEDFEVGNKTILNSSDDDQDQDKHDQSVDIRSDDDFVSDHEPSDQDQSDPEPVVIVQNPVYVNKRKRETSDIDIDVDMMTPQSTHNSNSDDQNFSHTGINLNTNPNLGSIGSVSSRSMSICSNNNITSTSLSNLKLSFSNSDSTPCPLPAKKKLKFKEHSTTPINTKKKLLNFSNSIKTNVKELNEHHFPDHYNDHELDESHSSPIETMFKSNIQSTPISQSTPSNSRMPSPVLEPQDPNPNASMKHESDSESEYYSDQDHHMVSEIQSPNLYSDTPIQPRTTSPHKVPVVETPTSTVRPHYQNPQTPINLTESKASINGYKLINKEVEYENIQDINTPADTHIADQRIELPEEDESLDPRHNDPYLSEPKVDESLQKLQFRSQYMVSKTQLPILEPIPDSIADILDLLTNENVLEFYHYILLPRETLTDLLRLERVKWHPDKWVTNSSVDSRVVETISKCINSLLEQSA